MQTAIYWQNKVTHLKAAAPEPKNICESVSMYKVSGQQNKQKTNWTCLSIFA